jgi:hypothetical protein
MDNSNSLPDLISQLKKSTLTNELPQFEGLFAHLCQAWRGWETDLNDDAPCIAVALALLNLIGAGDQTEASLLEQLSKSASLWECQCWNRTQRWNPLEQTLMAFQAKFSATQPIICFIGAKNWPSKPELEQALTRFSKLRLSDVSSRLNQSAWSASSHSFIVPSPVGARFGELPRARLNGSGHGHGH